MGNSVTSPQPSGTDAMTRRQHLSATQDQPPAQRAVGAPQAPAQPTNTQVTDFGRFYNLHYKRHVAQTGHMWQVVRLMSVFGSIALAFLNPRALFMLPVLWWIAAASD